MPIQFAIVFAQMLHVMARALLLVLRSVLFPGGAAMPCADVPIPLAVWTPFYARGMALYRQTV